MKAFFEPLGADGNYGERKYVGQVADNVAYSRASKAYPDSPEYVEEMLDGRGYIFIPAHKGRFVYIQDS